MNQEKIGKFISNARKQKNLTQEDLAELLNVSSKTISNWENGRRMPDYSILLDLCKTLDITVNEFLSGEKLSKENYQKELEVNMVKLVNSVNNKFNKFLKVMGIILSSIIALVLIYFLLWHIDDVRIKGCKYSLFHTITHNKARSICGSHYKEELQMIDDYFNQKDNPNEIKFVSYESFYGEGTLGVFSTIRYYGVYEEIYELQSDTLLFLKNDYNIYKTTFNYEGKNTNLKVDLYPMNDNDELNNIYKDEAIVKKFTENVYDKVDDYIIKNDLNIKNRENLQKIDTIPNKTKIKSIAASKMTKINELYGKDTKLSLNNDNKNYDISIRENKLKIIDDNIILEYTNYGPEELNKTNKFSNTFYSLSITEIFAKNGTEYFTTKEYIDDFNFLNKIMDYLIEHTN